MTRPASYFSHRLCSLLAFLTLSATAAETPPTHPLVMPGASVGVEPIRRVNPDYPSRALSLGRDGWVLLSFAIVPGGDTDEVIALSSSDPMFETSAIRAVSRWKYELPEEGPGSAGGAQQSVMRFNLQGAGGGSFMAAYPEIEGLLNAGNLEEAKSRMPSAKAKVKFLLDDAMYHWLAFRIALASGDRIAAADELGMMDPVSNLLANEVRLPVLEAQIALAIENGQLRLAQAYIDGARTDERLKSSEAYPAFMQKLEGAEQTIAASVASGNPISVSARHFRQYWPHALTHHEFALGEVQGELKSVQVRCSNARVQHVDVLIDSGCKLPAGWKDCIVITEADPGTAFVLSEFPPEPAAQ